LASWPITVQLTLSALTVPLKPASPPNDLNLWSQRPGVVLHNLGHLGQDQKLKIRDRRGLNLSEREIEAEPVAYIVCGRNGVELKPQSYLSSFVNADTTADKLDIYQIMKAAGQVEAMLKL
jgi:hypothetical protein